MVSMPGKTKALFAVITIAIVVAGVYVYSNLLKIQDAILVAARGQLEARLEEALGTSVEIGSIVGKTLSQVVISDLMVGIHSDTGEPVLFAKHAEVCYSLFDIITRRKNITEAITSAALIEPEFHVKLPSDIELAREGTAIHLGQAVEVLETYRGSLSVRDGRVKVSGIPGLGRAFVISGITGGVSSTGSGIAGRVNLFLDDDRKSGITVTGGYDLKAKTVMCDTTLSGTMPRAWLGELRKIVDSAAPKLSGVISEESVAGVKTILAYTDTVDLEGGNVDIEAHVRPSPKGGLIIRGKASVREAYLNAGNINIRGFPGGAGQFEDLESRLNLVLDFQWDDQGLACQGKGQVSIGHVEWIDKEFGFSKVAAKGKAAVEFWKNPKDEALSLEGNIALDTPHLSAGAALEKAIGLASGVVQAEGPMSAGLTFAGKLSDSIEARGSFKVDKGTLLVKNIAPEIREVSGDMNAFFTFESKEGAIADYHGQVRLVSGYADASFPGQGIRHIQGQLTGLVDVSGKKGTPVKYKGLISIAEADVDLDHRQQPVESSLIGEPFGEIRVSQGIVDGQVEFEGESGGAFRFDSILNLANGRTNLSGSIEGLEFEVAEGEVGGKASFHGEYPGKIEYGGRLGLSGGKAEIRKGPPWLRNASGQLSGEIEIRGDSGGQPAYSGDLNISALTANACNLPGGIEAFSGEGQVALSFLYGDDRALQYSGVGRLIQGHVLARDVAGGIRRLEGPVTGSVNFKSRYPEKPAIDGVISAAGCILEVGEIEGFVKSVSGEGGAEIRFSAHGADLVAYSGKCTLDQAVVIADGVYPGLVEARGLAAAEVGFSSPGGGGLTYGGKAKIHSASICGERIYPGLESLDGNLVSEFSFASSDEGIRYEGIANLSSGKVVLKDGIEGLEHMDGDISGNVRFQGVGLDQGSFHGDAVISNGTLKAGQIAKGIESVEGAAHLDARFSGGFGVAPAYDGILTIRDASFKASDILDGVKSMVGKAQSKIDFKSNPSGPLLFEAAIDMSNVSFAAGRVFPGIRELGGNGKAHLKFRRSKGDDLDYGGKVTISEGTMNLDAIGSRLDNVAAWIEFDKESLDISGATGNFGKSRFEGRGLVHFGKKPEIDIVVKSRDLAMEDLGEIVVAGKPLNASGSAALDVRIKGFYPSLELLGDVSLYDVQAEHDVMKVPAKNIAGCLKFFGDSLSLENLTMIFMNSPTSVKGTVTDLADPHMNVTVSFTDMDLSQAREVFASGIGGDIKGRGEVTLNVSGSLEEIWTDGNFALSDVSLEVLEKPLEASGVRGKFRYGNNAITFTDTVISTMGGQVNLNGVTMLNKTVDEPRINPWTRLSLDINGISVKEAASYFVPEGITASGNLDAKALLEAEEGSYEVAGSCSITSGSIQKYAFDKMKAEFWAKDGTIGVKQLIAEGADGGLTATGIVYDSGDFEAQVSANAVTLGKLAESFGYQSITGTTSFVGTISRKDKKVSVDGLADIMKLELFGIQADSVVGRVRLEDGTIHLSNVSALRGKAAYSIKGSIGLNREDPALDLSANVSAMPVRDLASIMGIEQIPLNGQVAGKVAVRGTMENPEAEGDVRLMSGEIYGIKLDAASADFSYAGDVIDVRDLSVKIGALKIVTAGSVTLAGKLDLTVSMKDLNFAEIPIDIPGNPVNGGIAGFDGKIMGALEKPEVEGLVVARDVSVGNALFPDVSCHLKLDREEVRISHGVIHDGKGTASAEGSLGLPGPGNPLNFTVTLDEIDVETILAILRPGKNDQVEGRISGKADVRGNLSRPVIDLKLDTHGLVVGDIPLKSASLDAGIIGNYVELRLLRLFQSGGGYFEAVGNIKPGEPISLTASARRFDVSALSGMLGLKYFFKGSLDLAMSVQGELANPSATLSLRVSDGAVDKIGFDLLAARMTYDSGVLTIEDGEILQGRHKAVVFGKAPIAKTKLEAIGVTTYAPGEELDVRLQMINAKLEVLSMFYSGIEWAEGETNIDLHIAGTIQAPKLYGTAQVIDGTVKLLPIIDAFRNINTTISFEGTEARIDKLSCRLGEGKATVSGKVIFSGQQEPELDLRLETQEARVNTGVFRSLVDSDLRISGPVHRPLISGGASLVKAVISPDTWSWSGESLFDADLALTVRTDGDLRIRTKIMDIPASGSLKIGGTLKAPQVLGKAEARRGWFAYLGNEFVIRQAIAEFTENQGVMPRVEVEAETTSGATRIFIGLRGVLPGDLALELSSNPPMAHDEILALLSYPAALTRLLAGDVEGAFKDEIVRIFEQELRLQVSGGIARAFEDLLALDEFRFQRGGSNELTLRIGKYVVDSLYLSYEKALGPESYGVLRFDYFYRPGVVLTARFDEKGEKVFSVEARLRF